MHQEAKEYPSFPLGNRLYIRLGLNSRGKTFHTPSEEKEDYSACVAESRGLYTSLFSKRVYFLPSLLTI